jgi:short-subunit dehydrogenase
LIAGRKLPSSRDVAEAGFAALMAGRPLEIPGLLNKLTAFSPRITPRRIMPAIVRFAQEQT